MKVYGKIEQGHDPGAAIEVAAEVEIKISDNDHMIYQVYLEKVASGLTFRLYLTMHPHAPNSREAEYYFEKHRRVL